MDRKLRLKHPRGRKTVSMSKVKYGLLKSHLLACLGSRGQATFTEILKAIGKDFEKKGTVFQGSLPWHLEWVKLDLEARNIVKRVAGTSPQQYRV